MTSKTEKNKIAALIVNRNVPIILDISDSATSKSESNQLNPSSEEQGDIYPNKVVAFANSFNLTKCPKNNIIYIYVYKVDR